MLNKLSESKQAPLARVEVIKQKQANDNFHTNQRSGSVTLNQRDVDFIPDSALTGTRAHDDQPRIPAPLAGAEVPHPLQDTGKFPVSRG